MIKKLESEREYVLAVEIVDEYIQEDLQQFENWFEEMLNDGQQQLNILFKIDQLPISHISFKTIINDALFSMKNIEHCKHIAMVGHSKVEKIAIGMESLGYNKSKKGRTMKYFDAKDIDKAWEFINVR
jgi:hypothetical protein